MPGLLWEEKVRSRLSELPRFIYEASIPITGWQVANAAWDQRSVPNFGPEELKPFELGDRWEDPTSGGGFWPNVPFPGLGRRKGSCLLILRPGGGEWEATSSGGGCCVLTARSFAGLDTRHQEAVLLPNMYKGEESWTLRSKPLPA